MAVGVHTYGGWERAAGPPRSRTRRDARARSAAPRRLWALPLRGPATMASGALFGSCCRWDLGLAPAPSFRLRRDHAVRPRWRAPPAPRRRYDVVHAARRRCLRAPEQRSRGGRPFSHAGVWTRSVRRPYIKKVSYNNNSFMRSCMARAAACSLGIRSGPPSASRVTSPLSGCLPSVGGLATPPSLLHLAGAWCHAQKPCFELGVPKALKPGMPTMRLLLSSFLPSILSFGLIVRADTSSEPLG